eukprot:4301847-Pyramimonas_sp.AAC.1
MDDSGLRTSPTHFDVARGAAAAGIQQFFEAGKSINATLGADKLATASTRTALATAVCDRPELPRSVIKTSA